MSRGNYGSWRDVLSEKLSELALISSWASLVDMGNVRDSVRQAEFYVKREIARIDDMEPAKHA